MIPQRQQVLARLSECMDELRPQGVKTLAVFGSATRNEATARSDVDLLVEFERPVGLFQFFRLQHYLEEVLNVKRVDLVMPNALKPALRKRVLSEAVNVA